MQNLMMSFRDKLGLRGLGWLILEGALDRKDPSLVTFKAVGKKFMIEEVGCSNGFGGRGFDSKV